MALLVVFFLSCIYLDCRRSLVVIGGCANISDDLNIPKNSRVSGNVSSNLETSERVLMSLQNQRHQRNLTFRRFHVIIIKS